MMENEDEEEEEEEATAVGSLCRQMMSFELANLRGARWEPVLKPRIV
jgi:hypothetical protein